MFEILVETLKVTFLFMFLITFHYRIIESIKNIFRGDDF